MMSSGASFRTADSGVYADLVTAAVFKTVGAR
jgi:hypothetical protein